MRGDILKKILCFILSVVLVFNNAIFVYADISGTIPTPVPTLMPIPSSKIIEILAKIMHPEFGALEDFFKKDEIKEELDKEGAITYDNDYVYINSTTVNNINNIVQDSVHALDGYYLVTPQYTKEQLPSMIYGYDSLPDADKERFLKVINDYDTIVVLAGTESIKKPDNFYIGLLSNSDTFYVYTGNSSNWKSCVSRNMSDSDTFRGFRYTNFYAYRKPYSFPKEVCGESISTYSYLNYINSVYLMYGAPFKIFYSYNDAQKYLNNGEQRTYAPKLPNVTIKIPVKYINNSVSLPDITYNITTENKTEVEIQNQYDTTIKNYLDSLDNFTDGTDPTPTPKPDGGFTDGTTPTPTPAIGDGSDDSGNGKVDLSEIMDLLKKILDKLTSFADSHSKFEKVITDYIEANDGKLDQIIEAINVLSDGKTEDEKNGCKYDFTALSDFMTDLWNESDKKFDTMIDLLEENNKYQQKLVNSLNEIKAILVTQTIMGVFQDRSQQTAEKAKDKFPTSLPWDIALVVNAMSAEPEKPQFNLPIQIKSLNINEEIHVDLASSEWEKLAKTCRYLLSILFILLMIQLSRNLFFNGGDD